MALIPNEGSWFALNHVSADRIPAAALPTRYAGTGPRSFGSAIYALLTRADFSAMHRLRTEETWHFYEGEPAELVLLHPDGRGEVLCLGPDTLAGQHAQVTVPAGVWMGARPGGKNGDAYTFFGCTLAPGFDYADYESGWRDELVSAYPAQAVVIAALIRPEFFTRPAANADAGVGMGAAVADKPAPAAERSWVFAAADAPRIVAGPGVSLHELAGRTGRARTEEVSFARFRLEAGCGTGSSRYVGGDEYFLIIQGTGVATLGAEPAPVGPGSVVVIKRGEPHAMMADADGPLEFFTVLAPAFNPAHYQAGTQNGA